MKKVLLVIAHALVASPLVGCAAADGGDAQADSVATEADAVTNISPSCTSAARLCNAGATVQCATLAATYASGSAHCRTDCSGYDVSTCGRALPVTNRERVRPADRDPRWAGARCNDGTPLSFQVRLSKSGHSRAWAIGLAGGESCDDVRAPCSQRPPPLTTTEGPDKDWSPAFLQSVPGPPQALTGPFDQNPLENPALADANHVWIQNCTSDYYSGATTNLIPNSASASGWYFSGRVGVGAVLDILRQRYGLDGDDPTTQLLVIGQSAGGVGAIANADQFVAAASRAARSGGVRFVLEGAWHGDFNDPAFRFGTATVSDRQAFRAAYSFWKARNNAACELHAKLTGGHPGDCFLGSVGYPSITSPRPAGYGLPTLVHQNAGDPILNGDHNVSDPASPLVSNFESKIRNETADVKWLFSPDDRRAIGVPFPLQIISPFHVISSGFYIDNTTPLWRTGTTGTNFRDYFNRFWAAPTWCGGERVVFGQFSNLLAGWDALPPP
jgi:hypothetical protein